MQKSDGHSMVKGRLLVWRDREVICRKGVFQSEIIIKNNHGKWIRTYFSGL